MAETSAQKLRARLGHPVIDADGHTVEFLPALIPYLKKNGVAGDVEQFFQQALDFSDFFSQFSFPAVANRSKSSGVLISSG